ncbi:hypothetical protein [Azospirillum palustre]|nr:hypothetical protein [Azospirillum palustre]
MARRALQRQMAGQRDDRAGRQLVDVSTKVTAGLNQLAVLVEQLPWVEDEEMDPIVDLIGRLTTATVFLVGCTQAARDGRPLPKPDIVDQSALEALSAIERRIAAGADPLA